MKKNYLFISIIPLLLFAQLNADRSSKSNQSILKRPVVDNTFEMSLNGIDSATAYKMKRYFWKLKKYDKRPIRKSVWFDSTTFNNMVNLLTKERGPEHTGPDIKGQTDGIRIYFVSDSILNNGHLNTSIIIVSTKNYGLDPKAKAPSKYKHIDYYTHSVSDILFKHLDSIKGKTANRQFINTRGEKLYNFCLRFWANDSTSCQDDPHQIARGKGNKMVDQFGKDTIRTKSAWFDIKLLWAYAADKNHDGVRIYFSRHPKKYQSKAQSDTLKETFILVPTVKKGVYHKDSFKCLTKSGPYMKLLELAKLNKTPFALKSEEDGGDDKGELCPDACNPGDCDTCSTTGQKKPPLNKKDR